MKIITATLLLLVCAIFLTLTMSGCAVKPPIIITGPMGVQANNDAYKVVRIKNAGQAYWRFYLGPNNQQFVLYPGEVLFVKPSSKFWNKRQGLWAHAYLEVQTDGRVMESTFAGEQWFQTEITGNTWICDTGQVIGGEIILGGIPQSTYSFPTHFSYSVPFLPIGIQGSIR